MENSDKNATISDSLKQNTPFSNQLLLENNQNL